MTAVTYLFLLLLSAAGLRRVYKKELKEAAPASLPEISIVIAGKNEEARIDSLFASLAALDYPRDKYEIVFVDDNSTDATQAKVLEHVSPQLCLVQSGDQKQFPGKKGALDIGIRVAKYEIIAVTDADCRPEPQWLRAIAGEYRNGASFIYGFAPLRAAEATIAARFGVYENMKNWILMLGSGGMRFHYSCTARSLAFTRRFFVTAGGYKENADVLSGDDDLLLQAATTRGERVEAFAYSGAAVYSDAKPAMREYLRQKARHLSASTRYTVTSKLLLAAWHATAIAARLTVLSALFISEFRAAAFLIVAADFIAEYSFAKANGYHMRLTDLLLFPFIYQTTSIINYLNSRLRPHDWR